MARLLAREIMEDKVVRLAGERYSHEKPHGERYSRWGSNPGSIALGDERAPLKVPRVRDVEAGRERPLESYQQMKQQMTVDEQLQRAILLGLSQRDYEEFAGQFTDGFGLIQSTVSRRFQERSRDVLEECESRRIRDDYVGLWIDGKYLAKQQIVICLGLTMDGRKVPLGFVETTTENSIAIKGLLRDLVERGVRFKQGLFCVIDGAKGLYKAVQDVFGPHAFIQRCQWHKRENVTSYLNKSDETTYRRKLQAAYNKPTYAKARKELLDLHAELQGLNRSAARSLAEGLEETLTLHRLGLFPQLGRSLETTNCIESLNSRLVKYIGKVKNWMHTDQRHRSIAEALTAVERKDESVSPLYRIHNYAKLHQLREAMLERLAERQPNMAIEEPLAASKIN